MRRAPSKNDQMRMTSRRALVAALYLRGLTQVAIAKEVESTQVTVSGDLAALREEWLAKAKEAFDQKKAEELAKIDAMEAEAWDAWKRSCGKGEKVHRKTEMSLPRRGKDEQDKPLIGPDGKKLKTAPAPQPKPELIPTKVIEERFRWKNVGDERFLGRVAWCIETRLKIIGALTEKVVIAPSQQIDWDALTKREDEADVIEGKIEEVKQLGHQNGQAGNGQG